MLVCKGSTQAGTFFETASKDQKRDGWIVWRMMCGIMVWQTTYTRTEVENRDMLYRPQNNWEKVKGIKNIMCVHLLG